ncbi:B3 domain-containing protein REM16-like [Nicotiana tabacum]|uniref:B3 domain-containing protein REM16-like n=1 Tax=Nicotiana tabacum TaxID=4097 RepID=A0A1S3WYB7_TOBAC|nr:PREDICTED: B3 domain-containing protein REM16-like [Nicotiana tabacum]
MATTCERCKVIEKQKYWEEFDKHRFFKVMMNDFRPRLRIPHKFVINLKDSYKLLGRKILRGPSGNTWTVEVKKREDNDYVFCNGWEQFVKDHCLEEADLLVFKMKSFSCFDVTIFDLSACEKEETFFVKKNRNPCKHPDEVTDEHTSDQEESSENGHSTEEESYGKKYVFHSSQLRKGKKMKKILIAKQQINRKRECTPSSTCKRNIEPEEKMPIFSNRHREEVFQQASRHKSSVPSFLMTMQPTHVYLGQLKLPKKWANRYMRKKYETINLRIPSSGRRWAVAVSYRQEGLVMQSGWEDFVMDNDLEEFDICVFELAQGGKHNLIPVVLDVYIYTSC